MGTRSRNHWLWSVPVLLSSVLYSEVHAMPENLCLRVGEPFFLGGLYWRDARLRASMAEMVNGRSVERGDIYTAGWTTVADSPENEPEWKCFPTSDLIDAFDDKELSGAYYFYNVRLEIMNGPDCHPAGDDSVHSWMDAPTSGSHYFTFNPGRSSCTRDW